MVGYVFSLVKCYIKISYLSELIFLKLRPSGEHHYGYEFGL